MPTNPPPPPSPPDPITAYYSLRTPYTALLTASHSTLPRWRDPITKRNCKPADEPSPFEDEKAGQTSVLGEEEGKVREGMREVMRKFEEVRVGDGEAEGGSGKEKEKGRTNGKK